MSFAGLPSTTDRPPTPLFDKLDAISTADVQFVYDMLEAAQEYIGETPGDRSDVGGRNYGSISANFRSICRMKTGRLNGEVAFFGFVVVDGVPTIYVGNSYWWYYKVDLPSGMFTEPPLFFATSNIDSTTYDGDIYSRNSGAYESLHAYDTTLDYVRVIGSGAKAKNWQLLGGAKDFDVNFFLIQPPFGRSDGGVAPSVGE